MSRLRILMADDQQAEVEEARLALVDMNHRVFMANTFAQAESLAKSETFDIAVIDLGWFTDESFKNQRDKAATAGWEIDDMIKERNEDAVRILYSNRANDADISQTATIRGMYCIQKLFTEHGRRHLADVVKVVAYRLAAETELKAKIESLETELEDAHRRIERLEDERNRLDEAGQRFRRVLITVALVPTIAVVLLVSTWLLTEQLTIAVIAAVGSAFLVLATLRATRLLSLGDLKYLGTLLQGLFRRQKRE